MENTLLIAYLPILEPWPYHIEDIFYKKLNSVLDEIHKLSDKLSISFDQYGVVNPQIELLNNKSQLKDWFEPQVIENHEFTKITVNLSVPESIEGIEVEDNFRLIDSTGKEIYKDTKPAVQLNKHLILRLFEKRIYDLVVATNIAKPGTLGVSQGIIVQDGYKTKTEKMVSHSLREALILATAIGWPTLQELEIAKVWRWLADQQDFLDGYGENPLSRALGALTYLFDEKFDLDPALLLWALVGVEALYVRGQSGLIEQVREKTKTFLGAPKAFKKKLQRMYDFRSRFVHGDLNFPGRHSLRETQEMEYVRELNEAISLAIAILIASFQELVVRDWKALHFSYTVDGADS